jgi:DNA-directed RNA polymerase specialized sigma24 family protein
MPMPILHLTERFFRSAVSRMCGSQKGALNGPQNNKGGAGIGPRQFEDQFENLVHLDGAVADTDPRTRRVVERRFFGGFSVDELAAILELSPRTVLLDWRLAKASLRRELKWGSRARR